MAIRSALIALALASSVALLAALGWPASTYRDNDFFQFWAAPHALLEGASPYDIEWWRDFRERHPSRDLARSPLPGTASPYPLWTHALLVPLALLPFELAAPVWLVAQVAAIALGIAVLRRTVLRIAPRRDGVLLAGLALAFEPAWLTVGGGNASGFLFAIAACALGAAHSGRATGSGAIAAFAAAKPQGFLLALPALLAGLRRGRGAFVAGSAIVLVALVAISLALRPGWVGEWVGNATALQLSTGSNATGWTLDRAVALGPWLPALAVGALVVAWLAWARARRPDLALLYGSGLAVSIFAAPHGWSYDQMLLLVTAAAILDRLASLSEPRRLAGLVSLYATLGVLPWILYLLAVERGGEEWSAVTPLVALGLLLGVDALAGARERAVRPSPA